MCSRKREGSSKSIWFPANFQQTSDPRNKTGDKNVRVREAPGYGGPCMGSQDPSSAL